MQMERQVEEEFRPQMREVLQGKVDNAAASLILLQRARQRNVVFPRFRALLITDSTDSVSRKGGGG